MQPEFLELFAHLQSSDADHWAALVNPHDPDAKIGRTKDGATDMIYKPEVVVDLDTGAIVQADVHPGDQADHKEMAARVLEAQQTINKATGEKPDTLTVTSGHRGIEAVEALAHITRLNGDEHFETAGKTQHDFSNARTKAAPKGI